MSSQVCDQLLALDELCQQAIGDGTNTTLYVLDNHVHAMKKVWHADNIFKHHVYP